MKKTIIAMVAAVAATVYSAGAMAQTVPAGMYVGVAGEWMKGSNKHDSSTGAAGVNVGYDFNKIVSAEFDFRSAWARGNQKSEQTAVLNAIVGTPMHLGFAEVKPYALVGTGYGFTNARHGNTETNAIYNLGAGVAYAVTKNVDLDVRYTHVDTYNQHGHSANTLGMGVNYRF